MSQGSGAARSYARALYELAKERRQTDAVAKELEAVVALIGGEPQLRSLLGRPWVSASVKRGVALEIAGQMNLSPLLRDFVGLVARQGRAGALGDIAQAYRQLQDDDEGRVRARVRTAIPLHDAERRALQQRLGQALGAREVVLDETVDSELLGGFVAEVGSFIVDGSLDGQLAQLRERLARG
jgi:F-type H+-transporting ATPase subunit delta